MMHESNVSCSGPADAVGIMMKVFPADAVGIQVISCSVLLILLLLRWESSSELLHNTNPLRQLCVQKIVRSATDTGGFVCSSGKRDRSSDLFALFYRGFVSAVVATT
jgi:hypothetical protein